MNWIAINWETILFVAAIIDVIIGALPQSWVKYTGIVLKIAQGLKDFDIKKGKN